MWNDTVEHLVTDTIRSPMAIGVIQNVTPIRRTTRVGTKTFATKDGQKIMTTQYDGKESVARARLCIPPHLRSTSSTFYLLSQIRSPFANIPLPHGASPN